MDIDDISVEGIIMKSFIEDFKTAIDELLNELLDF